MKKADLIRLITFLFESKFKKYSETTIDSWVYLLQDYPDKVLIKTINEFIYDNEDFITIGKIHDSILDKASLLNEAEILKVKKMKYQKFTTDDKSQIEFK